MTDEQHRLPYISIGYEPRDVDDKKPYIARLKLEYVSYFAEGATPSEALMLAAAHWHSRCTGR